MDSEPISLSERLIAGCLSGLLMGITAVLVPIGMALIGKTSSGGRGLSFLSIFGTFHIWGMSLIALAAIAGVSLGTERVTTMFGHLWGTEDPKNPAMTAALWIFLLGIALASYWFFGQHRAL